MTRSWTNDEQTGEWGEYARSQLRELEKELAAAAGGGGGGAQPVTRGKYGYNPVTILANDFGFAEFGALAAGGTALLDLTTANKPLIVTAGTYAVAVTVSLDDNLTAGDYYNAQLTLDVDGGNNQAYVSAQALATATILAPVLTLSLTWYLPAGAAIQVGIGNNSLNAHDYSIPPTCVQRLA